MFYTRFKLREPRTRVIPRGPGFGWARTTRCEVDGTVISFKTPRHRPRHANHEPLLPKRAYRLEDTHFRSYYDTGAKAGDDWEVYDLFHHSWAFNGPWFSGTLAELEMYLRLARLKQHENPAVSLFHPRVFEQRVGDYLTNEFSTFVDEDKPNRYHYIAPVDWRPLDGLPVVAVRLQVIPDETVVSRTTRHFVFFPITDRVMACFQFIPSQLRAASQAELDRRVSRAPMYALMDRIIDSIELSLSPQALASQQAALKGLDDSSLVRVYAPMKWQRSSLPEITLQLEP